MTSKFPVRLAISEVISSWGHDLRYSLDSTKFRSEIAGEPRIAFADGLRQTVEWYLRHRSCLDHAHKGEDRGYYDHLHDFRAETLRKQTQLNNWNS